MALFVYIFLGILIGVVEVRRHFGGVPFDAMTVFNFFYFVLFVLMPINVMCFGESVVRQQYAYETYGSGDASTALSLFSAYLLFCFGYWVKLPKGRVVIAREANSFSLRDSVHLAKVIFYLGILFALIYVIQIGGISAAISEASYVRSGDLTIESKYVFLRYFCPFSADAFVLFFAVVLGKRLRKLKITTGDKAFLVCAFVFFAYYALSTGGRRPFIYPILLCYLVYWSLGGKMKKAAVVGLVLVFVIAGLGAFLGPVVLSGNWSTLFDLFNINQADWRGLSEIAYDDATSGLADSFMHFAAAQKASLWQFGFLADISSLPRDFLPSRVLGFEKKRDSMLDASTEFILGHPIQEGVTGEEPLGLQGYLLVNFGYLGMFVLFFALGVLYKWLHNRFMPTDPKDAVGWVIYWWFVLGFFIYLRDGMVIFVLKEQLTWWLITALLIYQRAKRQPLSQRRRRSSAPAYTES